MQHSNPSFRLMIPDLPQRGDPFSHPSGSSASLADVLVGPLSTRKEPAGLLRSELPPARFSWSTVLLPHAPILASACVHPLCAHPATGGSRKRSVPVRVHSVSKELWFAKTCCQAPGPTRC